MRAFSYEAGLGCVPTLREIRDASGRSVDASVLLSSLWAGETFAMRDLLVLTQMEQFYKAYGKGEPVSEALHQAQLQTIASLREQTKATLGESLAP